MKINKDSNLFKNTKKFVYVSAITGALLAGTQAGYLVSTYTAHADENVQSSVVNVNFVDQFGNPIQKSYGSNEVTTANYEIGVEANTTRSKDYFIGILQLQFPGVSTSENNIPDNIDLSKPATYTFKLVQPTHTLTVNLVDSSNNVVNTKTISGVTNYGKSDITDLFNWANEHNYDTNGFPTLVSNGENVKNISVSLIKNTDDTKTTTTAPSSSASQSSQSSAVASSTQSTIQSSSSSHVVQSSSAQSSSSSQIFHSSNAESNSTVSSSALSEKSSANSVVSSQSANSIHSQEPQTQEPNHTEAVSRPYDPVNYGEENKTRNVKHIKQSPVDFIENKANKKLPQTGDNTHQARAIALGVATIAVGLGVAYYGLRKRNK